MHYSLFLTAYHYSLGVFFPAKDTKASAIEGCQTSMSLTLSDTECMSSLDIYVSFKPEAIKILKRCILDSHLPFGAVPSGFQPGLAAVYLPLFQHEETVCPVYLPLFHSQYASHGHLLEEWF